MLKAIGGWMAAVPVALRLTAGFTLVLGMLSLVAWSGWRGVEGVGARGEEVATSAQLATDVSRALTQFGNARVAIRDYLLDGGDGFDRSTAALTEARRILSTTAGASSDQARQIADLSRRLGEWGDEIRQLRDRWAAYNAEVESNLFPLATETVRRLRALAERFPDDPAIAALAIDFLDGRGGVNRFMHRGDPAHVTPAQALMARAATLAAQASQGATMPDAARQELTGIADAITRYAAIHLTITRARAAAEAARNSGLAVMGPAISREADAFLAGLAARAQESRRQGQDILAQTQRSLMLVPAAAIALGLVLAFLLARSVTGPLSRLRASIAAIAGGETRSAVPDQARGDELGAMACALEALRGQVTEAYARQQMVEQLPVGIMVTDPHDEFRITYMNPHSVALLRPMETTLPVKADALVGRSIDVLHRNPAHQRALMADPSKLPHKARISLGQEVLDLSVSAVRDREGRYVAAMMCWTTATAQARLADRFEADMGVVIEALAATAAQVGQASTSLTGAARMAGTEAAEVATAGREAGADVQSVAASAEELASSVAEITRQVAQGAVVARAAADEARATNATVEGLAQAAARISDVVRLIGDIARQTNLLALNATIEAARAGEAGRGFAVVASEVKALATQTGRATEEIGGQITTLQQAAEGAVAALRSIGGTVGRMEEVAAAIAAAVEEQGAATREIARSAGRVAGSTEAVVTRIDLVRAGTEETGRDAEGLSGAVGELTAQTAALREKSRDFLASVRAA